MTMNRDIIKALQQLRNEPVFGDRTPEQAAVSKASLYARLGFDVEKMAVAPAYSWKDYAEFYLYQFRHNVLRPAMVGLGMFVLVVGGWMTSVSAAYESVPGDFLYPIKIVSEQARLSIATSDQARATLHMEFASRRLAEVNTLSNSSDSAKTAHMKTAVAAFNNEVTEVQSVMESFGNTDAGAELASALDVKVNEYVATIDQTVSGLDETSDVAEEVADAKVNAEEAGTQATEVLVDAAPTNAMAAEDFEKSFQKDLMQIEQDVKLTLGRITVIQQAVNNGVAVLPAGVDLRFMTSRLQHFNTQIHDAMNVLAAGGYRSAYDTVGEIKGTIAEVQQQVIDLELSVVAQRDWSVNVSPIEE